MLIALISDIHSNLPALEAVLKRIKEMRADAVFFTGDAVGYGPWPSESVSLLMENVSGGVFGNHDAGVIGKTDISNYYDTVRYVIEWTKEQLSQKQIEFLNSLKYISVHNVDNFEFMCSHGSPRAPELFEYLFNTAYVDTLYSVKDFLKNINFVGHSHFMNFFVMADNRSVELDISSPIEIKFTKPSICVVGSVGQPRDGDSRAGFVSFDTTTKLLKFHRVEYNVQLTVDKIKSLRLPRTFADRLLYGR
jgi:predicted phosphodiesterase